MTRLLMDVVEAFPRLHEGTLTLQELHSFLLGSHDSNGVFSAVEADGDQRWRLKGNH